MKVKELIEQLQQFPEYFEVLIRGDPVTEHYTPLRSDHLVTGEVQMLNRDQGFVRFEDSDHWTENSCVVIYKWDGFWAMMTPTTKKKE